MTLKSIYKEKSSAFKISLIFLLILLSFIITNLIGIGFSYIFFDQAISLAHDFSSKATVNSLKLLQSFTGIGLFVIPTLLYAYLTDFDLNINTRFNLQIILLSIAIILVINPFISFLYEWNKSINFPSWMLQYDVRAEEITKAFLEMSNFKDLIINLFIIGFIPAIGEELFFRGYLQKSFYKWVSNPHLAIFITAFLFSAIHMQFQGFLPRFVLGALLGYMFYWSSSIWVPIIAHFINNTVAVIFLYPSLSKYNLVTSTEASSNAVIFSITAVGVLLFLLEKKRNDISV